MAQPTGQIALAAGNSTEYFYYAQGSGLWDARNSAMLSKSGTGGVVAEGGANVATSNGSTRYTVSPAVLISAPYTILWKGRTDAGAGNNSMMFGNSGSPYSFWWHDRSGNMDVRPCTDGGAQQILAPNASPSTMAQYAMTVAANGAYAIYKNNTTTPVASGTVSGANPVWRLAEILDGYDATDFTAKGVIEYLNIVPSVLTTGQITSRFSDPYQVLAASNAAPTFSGPNIGNQSGTVGTPGSLNVASRFSDSDALTFSAIGSWPPGITVSSAGLISGTPTTAGVYAGLQVRATDTAAQTVDSDTFSFTINAAAQLVTAANSQQVNTASSGSVTQSSGGTIQLPPLSEWETGNLLPSQAGITVWINDEESGALMVKLTGISTAAVTAAFAPISHASLVAGTAYSVRTRLANGAQYTWTYLAS